MEIGKTPYELLASYVSGNISNDERISVEKWIAESEHNKKLFDEAQILWRSSGIRLQNKDIDTAQLLRELQIRIKQSQTPLGGVIVIVKPYKLYLRIAAGICLLLISYFFLIPRATDPNVIAEQNIVIESGDKVVTIYLPDSSKVWLNIDSRITYPKRFTSRRLWLDGEAFFQVRKDTVDFTVTTDHTLTRVLGTAFNIKEQADSLVTITVAEGTVKFSKRDSSEAEGITLKAKQKAIFKQQSKLYKIENNNNPFAAWRKSNNPIFETEKKNPEHFLINTFKWRKNQIKQSVIEGTLENNATLAAYKKIVLEVIYTKANGKRVTTTLIITDTAYPGRVLQYKKRLPDILSDKKTYSVKIKSAQVE